MLPDGDSCHGVAPCIVQRLHISAGQLRRIPLCGDSLTAKRSIKANNEILPMATMLPHRPRVADRSADLMLAQRSFLTLARALKRALDVIFLQLPQYQHRSHRCQESLRYHRSHIRSHRPQSKEWCPRNKHYRPVHSVFLIRFCS